MTTETKPAVNPSAEGAPQNTVPASTPRPDESRPDPRRTLYLAIGGGAAAILLIYLFIDARSARSALGQQREDNVKLQTQLSNLEEKLGDLHTAQKYREQERATARDDALRALDAGKEVESKITALRQELADWTAKRDKFLQGDEGKRVAANPKLVELAHAILNAPMPPPDAPDQLQKRLDNLLAVYRQTDESKVKDFKLTPETVKRIEQIASEAQEYSVAVAQASRAFTDLAAQAPAASGALGDTLKDALAALENEHARARQKKLQEALAKARAESDELLAQAEADANRAKAEAEAKAKRLLGDQLAGQIVADAETKKREQDRIRKEAEDKERKLALERDFAREETKIRGVLNLFIAGGEGEKVRIDNQRGPASLSRLQGNNALEDSEDGVRGLISFIARTYRPKDQTLAFVGGYGITQKQRLMASNIQALLRKYGELLVEKKLLAP